MKISELDLNLSVEDEEYKIQRLLAGDIVVPITLNKVMKYLHFDDEEVICRGKYCTECPFYNKNAAGKCLSSANNYVRNLIKGEMRASIEELL